MDDREHTWVWTEGGRQKMTCFKYAVPFTLHFNYRHAVDNHNNLRHQVPSIEETWQTIHWACRVFAFLIAMTEINVYLTMRTFVWKEEEFLSLIDFRCKLAWELINNKYWKMEETALR